ICIDDVDVVSLRHTLPACFDLAVLLGRRVRATLVHVATIDDGSSPTRTWHGPAPASLTQTLTITADDGRPLVIAHVGGVRGIAPTLGQLQVYVALSQRPGGPMVFGTRRVQSLVRAGDHLRVRDGDDVYVMQFQARDGGRAAYAIVDESVWRGPPSTRR